MTQIKIADVRRTHARPRLQIDLGGATVKTDRLLQKDVVAEPARDPSIEASRTIMDDAAWSAPSEGVHDEPRTR